MAHNQRQYIVDFLQRLQGQIITRLEAFDPQGPRFVGANVPPLDGVTTIAKVLERTDSNRNVTDPAFAPIERAALVMTEVANRQMPPNMIADIFKGQGKPNTGVGVPPEGATFSAVHLSVMVHPRSPHAPTGHGNWRYFELYDAQKNLIKWWFGGAANLTPALLNEEDCKSFHQTLKEHTEPHGEGSYRAMKTWCDEYFHNPFRKETLGVGGIFFDNLSDQKNPILDKSEVTRRPQSAKECVAFFESMGEAWISAYIPILENRGHLGWTEAERTAQLVRRGHMIDFFLAVDIGFRFGLATGSGSLDAMRLILPETAQWVHDPQGLPDKAVELVRVLSQPQNWA
ncbi:Coproporphyrinogen-III oxidase [Ceratobasidium sp. 392]|nr:Coproporphyrinogen-III oxidase [Ceratobasidium sp. 392]